jgi:predicted P-loop ATPase
MLKHSNDLKASSTPHREVADLLWTTLLQLNNSGKPIGNLRNVLVALRHAPDWRGVLAFDVFSNLVLTRQPPPWSDYNVERWGDDEDTATVEWFQEQGINAAISVIGRAIQRVAKENPFHPVRQYLNGLRWDKKSRIDTWLADYLGAKDSPYVRAVGSRFLISAVARIEKPGCQVDTMLILEGAQGILKSTSLKTLTAPWFADSLSKVGSKDASMEVAGAWLIEVSELDALSKAGNSAIKSFITRRHDRFRPPYGKRIVEQPRQLVFAGTTNASNYLKDPTGARRFWPVACGKIDLKRLERDRGQLWAEAVVRFQKGYVWHLETPELEALASVEQEMRFQLDPWEPDVREWLVGRDDVAIPEVLEGAFGLSRTKRNQSHDNRIAAILRRLGFQQYRPSKPPRTPRYRRVEPTPTAKKKTKKSHN